MELLMLKSTKAVQSMKPPHEKIPENVLAYMEYDCQTFLKYLVFQTKNLVFLIKNLALRSETFDLDRKIRYFKSKN